MKSEPFPQPEQQPAPPAPITSFRIDKLRDGGYIVGDAQGAAFATDDICLALDYIGEKLDPEPGEKTGFDCDMGCVALCETCSEAFTR